MEFTQADFDELAQPKHQVKWTRELSYNERSTMGRIRARAKSRQFRPAFADNTAQLQAVLLHAAVQYVFRGKGVPPDFVADINTIIKLAHERTAAEKESVDQNQRLLQQRIYQHILSVQTIGYAAMLGTIAFKCWRLEWPASLVADELGVRVWFVRRIAGQLCDYAEELGFPTYTPAQFKGKIFVDADAIAALYVQSNSVRLVSEMLGYEQNTVYRVLSQRGLRSKRPPVNLRAIQDAWLQSKNIAEVERRTGYVNRTVYRALKHLKLHTPVSRRNRV
jgi:hypothetical protein